MGGREVGASCPITRPIRCTRTDWIWSTIAYDDDSNPFPAVGPTGTRKDGVPVIVLVNAMSVTSA